MREASLPKFLPKDVLLFEKIMRDIFCGATVSKANQIVLEVIRPLKIITNHLYVEYQLRNYNRCEFKMLVIPEILYSC